MTAPLRTVVTGSSGGIGAAVVARLRARGDRVVGMDVAAGSDSVAADLASRAERERAIAEATGILGGVDVLVNVAGVFRSGGVADTGPDDWAAVWAIDLEAPIHLMHLVASGMTAQGFGRIVNITSVHARQAQRGCLAYDVAKAGLEAATRSAALDLGIRGVLVNAVAPGFVRTRMSTLEDGTDETDTPGFRAMYIEGGKLPLGRGASAGEIAPAVEFLSSRDNTYATGQVLTVDGGLSTTF